MPQIYVDADSCPVKEETYRVALRHRVRVFVVSNSYLPRPLSGDVEMVSVPGGFDAADDWIAERAGRGDVVVSADIPLAARCLESGAQVLDPKGRFFTEDSIGDAVAVRELSSQLRDMGVLSGGPKPFGKQDRSRFLQSLEQALRRAAKRK
ncbi:MAG: YaiI/YqxD family protein [Acidobacteriota bacterium]